MFFLTKEAANLCLERWDYIKETLQKNQKINTFVKTWPKEMVRWGT